ncbi:MAG TPA: response regulator [Anaeromyxobacteraceae bacterium]|nr:response regulator [Anaeromyxobacteraceae bacterium]
MVPHRVLRILVVDDNEALRENMCELLESEGFEVSAVADGHAALRRVELEPRPDVVLLDLMLPGLDGKQVAAAIRAEPRYAGVRIVIVTGLPPGPQSRKAIPADAFVAKPFGIAQLVETIRTASGERAA